MGKVKKGTLPIYLFICHGYITDGNNKARVI